MLNQFYFAALEFSWNIKSKFHNKQEKSVSNSQNTNLALNKGSRVDAYI
jgi:hypothetical protein